MSWAYVQSNITTLGTPAASVIVSLTGVTAGHLVRVTTTGYSAATTGVVVTDNAGTVWTSAGFAINSNWFVAESWGIAGGSGSVAFKGTPNNSPYLNIAVCEYSFAPGATIAASTTATGTSSGTAVSSGAVTFASSGNYMLCGSATAAGSSNTWTAGSSFTLRRSEGSNNYGLATEDFVTTSATSPLAATFTDSQGTQWAALGVAYREILSVTFPRNPLIIQQPRQQPRQQKPIQAKSPGGNPGLRPRTTPASLARFPARTVRAILAATRYVPPVANTVQPRYFPVPYRRPGRGGQPLFLRQTVAGIAPTVPPIGFNLDAWSCLLLNSDSDPLAVDFEHAVIVDT